MPKLRPGTLVTVREDRRHLFAGFLTVEVVDNLVVERQLNPQTVICQVMTPIEAPLRTDRLLLRMTSLLVLY